MSRFAARAPWVAIAAALVLLPALPISRWAAAPDQGPSTWNTVVELWGLGAVIVGGVALVAAMVASRVALPRLRWPVIRPVVAAACVAGVFVLVAGYTMWAAFAANPELLDEMAQLFQGRVFAAGRLAAPAPEPPEFFLTQLTTITSAGWVAQFPPGHSLLLAAGQLIGAAWLVNPILGGLSVLLVYGLGAQLYGPRTGFIAAVLWAASSWVLFMSASYMNHVSATALALVSCVALLGNRRPGRARFALAGCALAAVAAIRPLDAIAMAIPLALWCLHRERIRHVAWGVLGAVPIALVWGYVNWRQFGSPFTLGYSVVFGPEHGLGFHSDPFGFEFTPAVALSNMASAIRRLHIYLYEAPVPILLPLGLWAVVAGHRHPSDRVLALGIAAAPLLYLFYWHSGFFRGPRFYYAAVPFIVLGLARAGVWAGRRLRRLPVGRFRFAPAAAVALMIVTVWSLGGMVPDRFRVYRDSLPAFKLHPERELAVQGVRQALVLVPESWTSRTIVDLWGMGARPGLTELVAARADACDLYLLASSARRDAIPPDSLEHALRAFLAPQRPRAPRVSGWPDPALRLHPKTLPDPCVTEMQRDRAGFTVYGAFAWRNAVARDERIVFARDLYERNRLLLARYPGWEVWRFAPPAKNPLAPPVLTRLAPGDLEVPN